MMKVFISYSHKDAAALDRLHVHLARLRDEGRIDTWYDRDILAGSDFDAKIAEQLEICELFLLLISPDFLDSDYCVKYEMKRALERCETEEARVVPIIIEPCDWKSLPLQKLKAVPTDGKPVSEWKNENSAYLDVVKELRSILDTNEASRMSTTTGEEVPTEPHPEDRRYRVKQDFDEIDRSDFRDSAFASICDYFQRKIAEINSIEDLRGRFASLSSTSFGCTIVNRARERGTVHITIHSHSGNVGIGDISYSFSENAPAGAANGWFIIEPGEYELYLKHRPIITGLSDQERLLPEAAADRLWTELLQEAGVTHD